jgi:SpoVK/Ycf46/Vps4 family AAA+-type ATPase
MSATIQPPEVSSQASGGTSNYLHALLGWLHRLLAWQVTLTRQTYGALADDEYRGLYIPDAEVDILGAEQSPIPSELAELRMHLAAERAAIEAAARGQASPLLRVTELFGLSRLESDVLLLALAPEIDLRYERLFAYIQDDVTKKRPTVDLALRLLCTEPAERLWARGVFAPDAPLLRQQLIQLVEEGQRHPPLLARYLKLDDRIVAELLGRPAIDTAIEPFVALLRPARALDTLVLPRELVAQLRQIVAGHQSGLALALQGSYGSGRAAVAEALCAELGVPLLAVALDRLRESELQPVESLRRILREAALQGAAILWQGASALLGDSLASTGQGDGSAWRQAFLAALDEHHGRSFLALDQPWEARGALRRTRFLRVELPAPSFSEREQIWRRQLDGDSSLSRDEGRLDDATLQALASTFRLSGGQIRDAVTMARALSHWRDRPLHPHDLYAASRAQSSGKLDSLAHKITATYGWDDIVLPGDQTGQLREICIQVRHRRTVLESWGFDRHLAMGKGVNVLFAGSSGTGKTMAAEIIAADLGLELYKVDLSTLVSKYIGETEKNLDRVFTAAREANAILFFDEADALFGKRSEVKDAHDRYANIEVGYLLQKMEEYDGIVILATNLRKNMDDAFVRRLHVAIDFPFPEEPDRLRIWQKVFPPDAPLADDVDLAFLAKQFKLTGGNIRNIALLAAYLAAEDGRAIGMAHVVRAIKREYQKLGKLVTAAEFGKWLEVAKA